MTERPDDKLQLPFQNSAESFHNKAASGRWKLMSGRWKLMSKRWNCCTQFPYMMLDRRDHDDWRPNSWTLYARLALWRTSSGRDHTSSGRFQPSSHNWLEVETLMLAKHWMASGRYSHVVRTDLLEHWDLLKLWRASGWFAIMSGRMQPWTVWSF